LGSPIQLYAAGNRGGKFPGLIIRLNNLISNLVLIWNEESGKELVRLVDDFLLWRGIHWENTTLTYAAFTPESTFEKGSAIIWLHGGGEGGSDSTIALHGK